MATIEEVERASLEYFNGDELPANVFATKYALADREGNLLEMTPDDMHHRLAKEFARIEAKYPNPMSEDEIYGMLKDFKQVIPQGSPCAAIGNPYQIQSTSNCFVIESPYDSYGGICKTDQELVQIAKRRGGVGFDISTLRPKGMSTANAAKTTDGIEIFMERFSNSCREVAQNGRRGALLQSISVHHNQVLDFVKIKRNKNKVTGANISVRLTDEFMNAVKRGEKYEQRFPVDSKTPVITKMVDAREVWDEIIKSAHGYAEPGLMFWDTVLRNSPADIYANHGFKTESFNPCGEISLCMYDSCRLILDNVYTFVKNKFLSNSFFDFEEFANVVQKSQRLMDDLVDIEIEQIDKILKKIDEDPEPVSIKQIEITMWNKIKEKAIKGRRTGLGLTGIGDTIAALNVKYGSNESIDIVEKIYKTLAINAYKSSCILAKERGAFPIYSYEQETDHPFIERIRAADPELNDMLKHYGRRNIALTTTPPAGSMSLFAQTSSGIEPVYKLWYTRRKKINAQDENARVDFVDQSGDRWTEYEVYHHGFQQWMKVLGYTKDHVEKSPYWKATAEEIDWVSKIKILAAAQKWVCHAISSTTNLPSSATIEDVKAVYEAGWELGCKGVTVYRDGCRSGVLIDKKKEEKKIFTACNAPKRPAELPCEIHHVTIKGEEWTILVGLLENKPYEIMGGLSSFVEIPKKFKEGILIKKSKKNKTSVYDLKMGTGDDEMKIKDVVSAFENPNHSDFTRVLSLSLRHGAEPQYIVEQLQKGDKDADLFSFSKVIARVLKKFIAEGTKPSGNADCTDCGGIGTLKYTEGCVSCTNCGSGKC